MWKKNVTQLGCLFLSSLPPTRPKDAMRALKKRLCGNKNYREVMLALTVRRCEAGDAGSLHAELPHAWTPSSPSPPPSLSLQVLETCVKNCGHRFHVHVANRDFMDGVLVKIIAPKNNPPTIVQDKVLSLIQVC